MRIGVLTSSRADYGIYLPLLQKLKTDSFFELEIIAFGTHLSKNHGYTLTDIEKDGYKTIHKISSLIDDDSQKSITISYGNTIIKFSDFWDNNSFDLVLCLGDRFEMSAAVQASIPFGVKLAHIHGGETTLGAIDNIYRHQITLASSLHFASTEFYKNKIRTLTETKENILNVGSLSLDNITSFNPIEKDEFYNKFNIPDKDFALVTFHSETVKVNKNSHFANEMKIALTEILNSLNLIITMPNADTLESEYRKKIEELKRENEEKVILVENFGKVNYFSAMYYAKILIGNTSSGILEAASFNKYVVNIGDRQKGRLQSENVLDAGFKANDIMLRYNEAIMLGEFKGDNIYYKKGVAKSIIKIIKQHEKF